MSRTIVLRNEWILDDGELEEISQPRRGLIEERATADDPYSFEMTFGIVSTYKRQLRVMSPLLSGKHRVAQTVSYSVSLLGFGALVALMLRRHLGSRFVELGSPIWLPPDPLDSHVARDLARIVLLAVSSSYFATLLGQTLTFSAREFHASIRAQALVLLVSRLDILPGFLLLLFVNRTGRVAVIRIATVLGALFSVLSAFAPNLFVLAFFQLGAKGATAAIGVLITISAAETVSARQRAWAIATLVIGAALGAGACDVLLPLAGLSLSSWRILYLVSLPLGASGVYLSFGVRETERYARSYQMAKTGLRARTRVNISRTRLIALGTVAFLANAFLIPTTQFRNQYLRVERHFSATSIAIFVILTSVPGAIGLAVGGRLAETQGRRIVAAVAIVLGGGGIALGFVSSGIGLWAWTIVGSAIVSAIVPSLGVYQTEMFSTASRGIGGGIVTGASRVGSIVGVAFVGYFATSISLGSAVALLFFGMLFMLPVLYFYFPETKGMTLEEITKDE